MNARFSANIPPPNDPESLEKLCQKYSAEVGVCPNVHKDDFIFRFLIENPVFKSADEAVSYYFKDGATSTQKIEHLLFNELDFRRECPLNFLEFASGYGCVTRHLVKKLPSVTITACDIHPEAIDFVRTDLSTDAIQSNSVPEEVVFPEKYDVILAMSFFSHMPKSTWGRWLKKLFSGLSDNGVLIFTTHGTMSSKYYFGSPEFDENGFWFSPGAEQKDLDSAEYGSTIVTPEFVLSEARKQTGAEIILYRHAFWWGHQDLYVIRKSSG